MCVHTPLRLQKVLISQKIPCSVGVVGGVAKIKVA